MVFHPDERYIQHVLAPAYERHKQRYLPIMLWINRAHVIMLSRQGILPPNQAEVLMTAMANLDMVALSQSNYDPRFEDLFFTLEDQIARLAGQDAVGNMHIAFSRNDMDAALFRMSLRQDIVRIASQVLNLRRSLLGQVEQHVDTVMLAHTHNQQAQPYTLAHYLSAMEDQLQRDHERLLATLPRLNQSPMGACALGGTGYNIDRYLMAELLGFDGIVRNTYDAVSTADYAAELLGVQQILLSNLSRFVHDMMFWSSNEVNAIQLADEYVQSSSIMPQKRNPVAMEHVRSLIGRALGQAQGLWMAFHNVPFGDINDTADNIQSHLDAIQWLLEGALTLLTGMVNSMHVNKELLLTRAKNSLASTTELADTLVRQCGFSFRMAHRVVSEFVNNVSRNGVGATESYALYSATSHEVDASKPLLSRQIFAQALDPVYFVNVRSLTGGPAPSEMNRLLREARLRLEQDQTSATQWQMKFGDALRKVEVS